MMIRLFSAVPTRSHALRPDTVASVGQLPVGSLLQPETAGVTGR